MVNVTVENLAPCKKLLRVEVDAQTVDAEFQTVTTEFRRHAKVPGFRPGKIPLAQVAKVYGPEIESEAKRKLIADGFRQAVKDQKLRVVGRPDIEEIQFARSQPLQFAATVETAPEFELPEYQGLTVKIPRAVVTQADQERAMTILREKRATYLDVTHPVQTGNFVVVNYKGVCEGKAISEIAPTARSLSEQQNYWLHIEPNSFLPGFTEQLVGAQAGEQRTVTIDFPADFIQPPLAGKRATYEVQIVQVKERILPELNDEFAKAYGADNLDKLREGVRQDLQKEITHKQRGEIRNQLIRSLLDRVSCDLPESIVLAETRNVVYDIVRETQQRGITKEMIDKQKEEIYAHASNSAKERVKLAFLLGRIAEKENIQANEKEVTQRILALSQQYQIRPEKLIKQLQERNGIVEIENQIIDSKVLDFLQLKANIEESPASEY
jgi:trigger factor